MEEGGVQGDEVSVVFTVVYNLYGDYIGLSLYATVRMEKIEDDHILTMRVILHTSATEYYSSS